MLIKVFGGGKNGRGSYCNKLSGMFVTDYPRTSSRNKTKFRHQILYIATMSVCYVPNEREGTVSFLLSQKPTNQQLVTRKIMLWLRFR